MKPALNMIAPLPPKKSGIANYAQKISTELAADYDITFVVDQSTYETGPVDFEVIQFDDFLRDKTRMSNLSLLHMGNNSDHTHVYRAADYVEGLIVQHDLVLHHFIEDITLAKGNYDGYARILQREYGDVGLSLAAARRGGIFDDSAKFLFPAVSHFLRKGRGAIVHSEWAARRVRSFVPNNLFCIPHFVEDEILAQSGEEMRVSQFSRDLFERLGIPQDRFVIGSLGFATEPKCIRELATAVRLLRDRIPNLHLVIGGEMRIADFESELGEMIEAGQVTVTGYLDQAELEHLCARLDLLFNLRFPIAGESSGILSMAMGLGTPCAVFDFGPMAEVEKDECFLIPFRGTGHVLIDGLSEFLQDLHRRDPQEIAEVGRNGRRRMQSRNSMRVVAAQYNTAIDAVLGR